MKIERENTYTVKLEELDYGDAFECFDEVWSGVFIKCDMCKALAYGDDPEDAYGVRLSDGKVIGFLESETVCPIETKLTIL